jgi:hypothetical protein
MYVRRPIFNQSIQSGEGGAEEEDEDANKMGEAMCPGTGTSFSSSVGAVLSASSSSSLTRKAASARPS